MKQLLLYTIVSIFCFACAREKDIQVKEIVKIVDPFFESYRAKGPKVAVSKLLASNKFIPQSDVDSVGVRLERLVGNFGTYRGYDKVSSSKYGETIVEIIYLVNYEKQPLLFTLQFYQPGTGWRIQDFRYQSEFMDNLKDQ